MQVATKRLSFPASIAGARMMYDIYWRYSARNIHCK
jgi:hypothetical protein